MIDAQSQSVLLDVLRRESRSLLAYMGEAYPWAADEKSPALGALQRLVRKEGEAVNAVGRFLLRNHVTPPPLEPYPMQFTSLNFIDLKYLLPRLIDAERESIARLESAHLPRLDEQARPVVAQLLAVKRANLTALERLAAPQPEPAAV